MVLGRGAADRYRLIIAGGRDFQDPRVFDDGVRWALEDHTPGGAERYSEAQPWGPLEIVSGMARGADTMGANFARRNGIPLVEMPADWQRHGRSAGYRRNGEMAAAANGVLLFPGGRGTQHMADIALRQGLDVFDYRDPANPVFRQAGTGSSDAGAGAVSIADAPVFQIVPSRGRGASFDVLGMRQGGQTMATVKAPGEPGWLGNPWAADDAGGSLSREEVTRLFGELVEEKAQDPVWRDAFLALEGKRIGYYKPGEEHIHLHKLQDWIARNRSQPPAAQAPAAQAVNAPPPSAEPVIIAPLPTERMASSPEFLAQLRQHYDKLPEFVREDLLEGLLVGGGIAIPVALMPNQDGEERAAAILGGIGAASFGGALSKRLGAEIGGRMHPGELEQGSFGANIGRIMGRENMLDTVEDMLAVGARPAITGTEFGRAIGRAAGDELFGVAGTIGGLAAAQAMDQTPDPVPGPSMSEVAMATVPGALIGLAGSGLLGGMFDGVEMNRRLTLSDQGLAEAPGMEDLQGFSVFRRRQA